MAEEYEKGKQAFGESSVRRMAETRFGPCVLVTDGRQDGSFSEVRNCRRTQLRYASRYGALAQRYLQFPSLPMGNEAGS